MFDAVTPIITDFGTQIQGGVVELIGVLVPIGLTLWGIGFGIKKGLNFIQKRASKTV